MPGDTFGCANFELLIFHKWLYLEHLFFIFYKGLGPQAWRWQNKWLDEILPVSNENRVPTSQGPMKIDENEDILPKNLRR